MGENYKNYIKLFIISTVVCPSSIEMIFIDKEKILIQEPTKERGTHTNAVNISREYAEISFRQRWCIKNFVEETAPNTQLLHTRASFKARDAKAMARPDMCLQNACHFKLGGKG